MAVMRDYFLSFFPPCLLSNGLKGSVSKETVVLRQCGVKNVFGFVN